MAIFPFIELNTVTDTATLPIFTEIKWDFDNNLPFMENGNPVFVEKNEALKTWIYKALKTERYVYNGYTFNFGSETEKLIGSTLSEKATQSEVKRYISEALLANPYIKELKDFVVTATGDTVEARFKAVTIYGEVNINV